jgi:hypothetical protein
MCCLRYEHEFYVASRKRFPKEGKIISTLKGEEKVLLNDIFHDRVTLRGADGETRIITLLELKRETSAWTPGGTEEHSVADAREAAEEGELPFDDAPTMPTRTRVPPADRALPVLPARPAAPPPPAAVVATPSAAVPASLPDVDDDDDDDGEDGGDDDTVSDAADGTSEAPKRRRRRGRRGGRRGRGSRGGPAGDDTAAQ